MAALNVFEIPLGAVAPTNVPPEMFAPLNDIHLALHHLVIDLNRANPVMMSPNGHYWVATMSNTGVITWTDAGTVRP